jgi:ABC-2 type transport system ATP-binding protein
MSKYIVEVRGLNHNYRTHKKGAGFLCTLKDMFRRSVTNVEALKDISFNISSGEIVGLLGPNGAGKTTLLKILSGLIYPTSGISQVLGRMPHKKEHAFLKQIGMVMGQKSQLLWDIPALDTLHIIRELYAISRGEFDKRLGLFIDLLSIGHLLNNPVRKLSLGERMKFELVAALIHNPRLLFLDEPTIGLDIVSQRAIRDFLQSINRIQGTTIIITSHYMRDIEILAKRVLIIKQGTILHDTPIESLLKKFNHSQKVYFATEEKEFSLPLSFEKISSREYSTTCQPNELRRVVSDIASHVPLTSIRTEETSLEEAIFSIFDEKKESQ